MRDQERERERKREDQETNDCELIIRDCYQLWQSAIRQSSVHLLVTLTTLVIMKPYDVNNSGDV